MQNSTPKTAAPPAAMRHALVAAGLAGSVTCFKALGGGRTNRLWRFAHRGADLVCKLYTNAETPLFPNDPNAEATVLRHLSGRGLAPEFVASTRCDAGAIVVYRHVPGPGWSGDSGAVARLLQRLHRIAPPPGLRRLAQGAQALISQADAMLADALTPAHHLRLARPAAPDIEPGSAAFLHGDAVAENIIAAPAGLCLIDWQCPAIGDPTEDLAIFLSPAMQYLYGGRQLPADEEAAFLAAYGDDTVAERYRVLAPAYHWRMAAYCLWKAGRGDADYLDGFALEVARLKALR